VNAEKNTRSHTTIKISPKRMIVSKSITKLIPKEFRGVDESKKTVCKKKEETKGKEMLNMTHKEYSLIYKRTKNNKEIEKLKKRNREQIIKLTRKHLNERNKLIRDMNYKNYCKSQIMKTTWVKKESQPMKNIMNESERRSRLGLTFLDLKNKLLKREVKENNKDSEGKVSKKKLNSNVMKLKKVIKRLFTKPKTNFSKLKASKTASYITYLIPDKEKAAKKELSNTVRPDQQLMNTIRTELLNELQVKTTPEILKNSYSGYIKGNSKCKDSIDETKEQQLTVKSFEDYIVTDIKGKSLKKDKCTIENCIDLVITAVPIHKTKEVANDSKVIQNVNKNSINESTTKEEIVNAIKIQRAFRKHLVQLKAKRKITAETQTEEFILKNEEASFELSESMFSPLAKVRLLIDSEKRLNNSVKDTPVKKSLFKNDSESEKESLFNKNSFNEFTKRKLEQLLKKGSISDMIKTRERIYKYKEQEQKQIIQRMYIDKKMSPKTYHRKQKELERWVSQEREEITRTKKVLVNIWSKTAEMIKGTQQNTENINRLLMSNTASCISDTKENNVLVELNRPVTDREYANELSILSEDKGTQNASFNKVINERIHVQELNENSNSLISDSLFTLSESTKNPIRIAKLDTPKSHTNQILNNEEDIELEWETPQSKQIEEGVKSSPMTFTEIETTSKVDNVVDEITEYLYTTLIQNTLSDVISFNNHEISIKSKGTCNKLVGSIKMDKENMKKYIDLILNLELRRSKEFLLGEVMKSIIKNPIEVLEKLQKLGAKETQLLHEVEPIIHLNIYLDAQKLFEQECNYTEELKDNTQIHNRAIFDAINEALNLIRPYGLDGEPMPWDNQPRILFRSVTDEKIIIDNVRAMILEWASFNVGTLPKQDFITDGQFDEVYFADIRERRLSNLLIQEVMDNEDIWINYGIEETEVKMDIADLALDQLLTEAVKCLLKIENT